MQKNATKTGDGQDGGVRQLLNIMLMLVDDHRPAAQISMPEALGFVKNRLIELALQETNGNVAAAARLLGMNRTTIVEHRRKREKIGRSRINRRRNRTTGADHHTDILGHPRDPEPEKE